MVPIEELEKRIVNLQKILNVKGISGAFLLNNVSLFYYTGRIAPAYFYIPVQGKPIYLTRERGELPEIPWPKKKFKHWNDLVVGIKEYGHTLDDLIGIEMDSVPTSLYFKLSKAFSEASFIDLSMQIRQQRSVKSRWEINVLKETAKIDVNVWNKIPKFISQADSDLELAALIEGEARRLGHMGILRLHGLNQEMALTCILSDEKGNMASMYDAPLSGSGVSDAFPFGASGALLKEGSPILIDYGGCYYGYVIDQTRTYLIGKTKDSIKDAYDCSIRIQEEIVEKLRPGVRCGEIYEHARYIASYYGLAEYFMGSEGGVPFVGHGIGLEIDELPVLARGSSQTLQEGMVLAVEPKFTLPGIGAVGIENCYIVTAESPIKLTTVTDELVEIYK